MNEIVVMTPTQLDTLVRSSVAMAVAEIRETAISVATPEIMTKEELAIYLRCHVSKISRSMAKGLPYFMFGDHPRFRRSDIDGHFEAVQRQEDRPAGEELQ